MRANPGGVLASNEVVGRDQLISDIWRALEVQSVVLTSERRIGKTSVIRKMADEVSSAETLVILRDIEGLRTPEEFVEAIYADVEKQLNKVDRAKLGLWRLLEKLGGSQIVDVKLPAIRVHWKGLLTALFEDLFAAEQRRIIFFWDELPLFIFNVVRSSGENAAMELLDVLRSLRQQHRRLRMVFTGSVGIHQVINTLKKSGYANDPTNDMAIIEVPPLSPSDGRSLAEQLLIGEHLSSATHLSELGSEVADAVGHIPYYIHVLISRMRSRGDFVTVEEIRYERDSMIQDPNDPAHFSYYEERLKTYYSALDARLGQFALDVLCAASAPLTFEELTNLVRYKVDTVDDDNMRDVLKVLIKDHYLQRDRDGRYSFRYSIVQRWWRYARGRR
jgi:hypothetical protein